MLARLQVALEDVVPISFVIMPCVRFLNFLERRGDRSSRNDAPPLRISRRGPRRRLKKNSAHAPFSDKVGHANLVLQFFEVEEGIDADVDLPMDGQSWFGPIRRLAFLEGRHSEIDDPVGIGRANDGADGIVVRASDWAQTGRRPGGRRGKVL